MKKLLFLICALCCTAASAQTWEKKTEEADIINDTPERTYYELQMDSITTVKVYADNNEWYLTKKMANNAFKLTIKAFQMQVREIQTSASFAFLAADGKSAHQPLKNIKMTATYHGRTIGSGKWTDREADKVAVYLKTATGYVQIVAPLHFGGELNIKIPCIPASLQE